MKLRKKRIKKAKKVCNRCGQCCFHVAIKRKCPALIIHDDNTTSCGRREEYLCWRKMGNVRGFWFPDITFACLTNHLTRKYDFVGCPFNTDKPLKKIEVDKNWKKREI